MFVPEEVAGYALDIAHPVACRLQELAVLALMDAVPAFGDAPLAAQEAEQSIAGLVKSEGLVLSDLPERLVHDLAAATRATTDLMRRAEPPVFAGEARLFVATEESAPWCPRPAGFPTSTAPRSRAACLARTSTWPPPPR